MSSNASDDWRSSCSTIPEMLSTARDEHLFTDIEFVVGESEVLFPAHKSILACGSPVFEKMFYGPMAEKNDRIKIYEDDPQAFRMLLSYLYGKGGSIEIESFTCALKYYTIGDKYLVPGIRSNVEDWIQSSSVNEQAFWEIIQSNIFFSPLLEQKLNSYIEVNTEGILNSEEFLNVSETIVERILQMDKLNISEYKLLEFLTKWGCSNIGKEIMSKERLPLYQFIRFSTLTINEFCTFTDLFPYAIDSESCFKIMKHLYNKSTYELPDWCSASHSTRNASFSNRVFFHSRESFSKIPNYVFVDHRIVFSD